MSLLRARRTLFLTRMTLIKRETPDGTPPKEQGLSLYGVVYNVSILTKLVWININVSSL